MSAAINRKAAGGRTASKGARRAALTWSNFLGFTLVEMLIALAIFSLVSMTAGSLLYQAVEAQGKATSYGDRLINIERGIGRVVRDVSQYVPRTIRDEFGDTMEALRVAPSELEFTRGGWSNPAEHARSELQRVRYSLQGGAFVREYWDVLDRSPDSVSRSQILIKNVNGVTFQPITESEILYGAAAPLEEEAHLQVPLGVRLRLSVDGIGELIRVVEFAAIQPTAPVPDDDRSSPPESADDNPELSDSGTPENS